MLYEKLLNLIYVTFIYLRDFKNVLGIRESPTEFCESTWGRESGPCKAAVHVSLRRQAGVNEGVD